MLFLDFSGQAVDGVSHSLLPVEQCRTKPFFHRREAVRKPSPCNAAVDSRCVDVDLCRALFTVL